MRALILFAFLVVSAPALANHPGDRLDEVTAENETAFEQTRHHPPTLTVQRSDGQRFDLRNLEGRVVVLSFVPDDCEEPCTAQQARLIEVQEAINDTPMREMVAFVTVASPGQAATNSPDSVNWMTVIPPKPSAVAETAEEWANLSTRRGEAPKIYVLGRGARHAGIFHGAGFDRINMVLYINGLTNAHSPKPSLLDRFWSLFQ